MPTPSSGFLVRYNETMSILHKANDSTVFFWCPGCDESHQVIIAGPKAWNFNGDYEKPTFTPSYLINIKANPAANPKFRKGKYLTGFCCHSFVTDGKIAYLADSTHALAGQTVPLPVWPL